MFTLLPPFPFVHLSPLVLPHLVLSQVARPLRNTNLIAHVATVLLVQEFSCMLPVVALPTILQSLSPHKH